MRLTLLLAACTAADDTDAKAGDTAVDEPPSAPEVAIQPALPDTDDVLTVTLLTRSVDPEGAAVVYRYVWSVDDAATSEVAETVVPELTEDGQTWTVEVTPSDGVSDGPAGSASVTIGNPAPVAPTLHIDPAEPFGGDTLTVVFDALATDPNGDVLAETIEWYADGVHLAELDGSADVDGGQIDPGETWRVVVTESDGANPSVAAEDTVTVANRDPVLDRVYLSPSYPGTWDDLTAIVTASDPDGTEVTLSHRWYRDGVEVPEAGVGPIADHALTEPGETWYVEVTAWDGVAAVTGTSNTVTVTTPDMRRLVQTFYGVATLDAGGAWSDLTG